MLTASGTTRFGSATMASLFVMERAFCAHLVRRERLIFDVRFIPPFAGSSPDATVWLLSEGTFEILQPARQLLVGPVAFVLTQDDFEGSHGKRDFSFRSFGDPFVALDLRIARADVTLPMQQRPTCFEFGARGWDAMRQLHRDCMPPASNKPDSASLSALTRQVVESLEAAGVLRRGIAATVSAEDPAFSRMWSAVRPIAERFQVLPTLGELSQVSGLSLRQLAREVERFMGTFRLPGGGNWRDATKRVRMKVAVLSLSAPDATIAEAARATGYGSVEAMARAFRDAGLPSPSQVRAAIIAHMAQRNPM